MKRVFAIAKHNILLWCKETIRIINAVIDVYNPLTKEVPITAGYFNAETKETPITARYFNPEIRETPITAGYFPALNDEVLGT